MEDVEITEDEPEIVTEDQHDNGQDKEGDDFDWRADALKHRAIASRLKVKLAKLPTNAEPKIDDSLKNDVSYLKEIEAKRQFGFDHNLSPIETDYAYKFSGGKPTKETLEDEFFIGGLESLRAKQRLANNIPGSSSRSTIFADKSFAETPEEDRKKIFETKMKAIKK